MSHRTAHIKRLPVSALLMAAAGLILAGCEREQQADAELIQRIQQAMAHPERPEGDTARDAGRKPLEMSVFFGLREGMTLLDLSSGAGYNLDIFAAAVGPSGTVYAHNTQLGLDFRDGANRRAIEARLANSRLPNVIFWKRELDDLGLEAEVDLAYSGLNLHDYYQFVGEEGTVQVLKAIRKTLKPGGMLGLTDHRGEADRDNIELHRIEQQLAFRMIEAAGFEIVQTSELLANPADDHSKFIFDPEIVGRTDRFLLLAR